MQLWGNTKSSIIRAIENLYDKAQGAIISNEGSKPEILSRIAQTTAALSRLKIIWRDKNISLASNVNLVRTLILSTFLYGCKSWILTAEIERRTQALDLLTMVKKWVLRRYGHNSRSSGMAKTILQGTMKRARRRGRQKKRLEDKIQELTGMEFGDFLRAAEDREWWRGNFATPSQCICAPTIFEVLGLRCDEIMAESYVWLLYLT